MKKIVKEIFENNPELKKDSKKIEKTIELLDQTNPRIQASKEFKTSLKSRLNSLIWLKQNKKNNFIVFAVPAFSFMFVIGWFFYYFKDINFIWENNIDISNIEKISDEEFIKNELNEISEIFETELINEKNTVKETPKEKILRTIPKTKTLNEEINTIETMSFWTESISEEEVENIDLVDNEIVEIFGWLQADIDATVDINSNMKLESLGDSDIMMDEMEIAPKAMMMSIPELNFNDYCKQEWWEISWTGALQKCIIDKKECLASQFQNQTCEFKEVE